MFGTSRVLQTSDFEAPCDVCNAGTVSFRSSTRLDVSLSRAAMRALSLTSGNQFRFTLTPETFTNWNGVCHLAPTSLLHCIPGPACSI